MVVSIGVVQQRRHGFPKEEESVGVMVHSLKAALTSQCVDLRAAAYMVLSQLCAAVTLSGSVVNRLIGRLVKVTVVIVVVGYWRREGRRRGSMVLTNHSAIMS